jgi:hypothetical protein
MVEAKFIPRQVSEGFVVEKVAPEQDFLPKFGFLLSGPFHQCSIHIQSPVTDVVFSAIYSIIKYHNSKNVPSVSLLQMRFSNYDPTSMLIKVGKQRFVQCL